MLTLSTLFLLTCAILLGIRFGRESRASILLTPVLLFGALEMLLTWPATIIAQLEGSGVGALPSLLAGCGFLAFLLGAGFAGVVLRYRLAQAGVYAAAPLERVSRVGLFASILILTGFLTTVGLLLFSGFPDTLLALLDLMRGEPRSAVALMVGGSRRALTKAYYFGGEYRGQGLMRSLMQVGWPYVLSLTMTGVILWPQGRGWKLLLGLISVGFVAFLAGDGTRAPVIVGLLPLVVLLSFQQKLRVGRVLGVGLAGFGLLLLFTTISPKANRAFEEGNPLASLSLQLGQRIALGNGMNNVRIIELERDGRLEFRSGGIAAQRVRAALPGVSGGSPFSHEIYQLVNPGGRSTSFYSPTFLGFAYADFGIPGVVFHYFLIGVVLVLAQRYFFFLQKDPYRLALASTTVTFLALMCMRGFTGTFALLLVLTVLHTWAQGIRLVLERIGSKSTPVKAVARPDLGRLEVGR